MALLGTAADGADVHIDVDTLISTRLAVCANSGGGKSWLLRRILEQTHGQVPQHVIDPEGEFHTLRSAGLDYVIAGAHGDCPAEPGSAALLARKMLELRVSVVLDLYELAPAERVLFVERYLQALLDAPRELQQRSLVVIDEAHTFCPERGEGDASSRDAVIGIMSRGRKRGICGLLATQRLAKLHKSAAAEANNFLVGRTRLDVDLDRAAKMIGVDRKAAQHLRSLMPGRFHFFGPALGDDAGVVHVGPVKSRHPEIGARSAAPAAPPATVRRILAQLADLPAQAAAEAQTVDELRGRIAELEAQAATRPAAAAEPDPEAVRRAVELLRHETEAMFDQTQAELDAAIERLEEVSADVGKRAAMLRPDADLVREALAAGGGSGRTTPAAKRGRGKPDDAPDRRRRAPASLPLPAPSTVDRAAASYATEIVDEDRRDADITGPEDRVLSAIAWFELFKVARPSRHQVGFIADYRPSTSNFKNACGSCRSKGWIEYHPGSTMSLTPAGRRLTNQRLPDGVTPVGLFQGVILGKLSGPEGRVWRVLLAQQGRPLARAAVADQSGYAQSTSNFKNAMGRLRTLGLIDYPSKSQAAATRVAVTGVAFTVGAR